ncbi:hypothetical protein D3C80_1609770 [compost metagenome]
MPAAAAQNKKMRSVGSLIGVLKRTMDNAPTIPSDSTRLELIAIMIIAVTMVIPIRETLKLLEYRTPLNTRLYRMKINSPIIKDMPNVIKILDRLMSETKLSMIEFLIISLKLVVELLVVVVFINQ